MYSDTDAYSIFTVHWDSGFREERLVWTGTFDERKVLFNLFFQPVRPSEATDLKKYLKVLESASDRQAIIGNDFFSLLSRKFYRIETVDTKLSIINRDGLMIARLKPYEARYFILIDQMNIQEKVKILNEIYDDLENTVRVFAFDKLAADATIGFVPTDIKGLAPDFNPELGLELPEGKVTEEIVRSMNYYLLNGAPERSCYRIVMSGSRRADELRALKELNPDLKPKELRALLEKIKEHYVFHHAKEQLDPISGLLTCEIQIIVRSVHSIFSSTGHTGPVRVYERMYGGVEYAK